MADVWGVKAEGWIVGSEVNVYLYVKKDGHSMGDEVVE